MSLLRQLYPPSSSRPRLPAQTFRCNARARRSRSGQPGWVLWSGPTAAEGPAHCGLSGEKRNEPYTNELVSLPILELQARTLCSVPDLDEGIHAGTQPGAS